MDGVINTIKKYLEDIINKINQMSINIIKNKPVENTSVEFISMKKYYNDFYNIWNTSVNKNNDIVTIFEYNGEGYIEKFRLLDRLFHSGSGGGSSLKDIEIIIDDKVFATINKIDSTTGLTISTFTTSNDYSWHLDNPGVTIMYKYGTNSGELFISGIDVNIPINKYIKKNIKCVCKPQNFSNSGDKSLLICSAWIEHRK